MTEREKEERRITVNALIARLKEKDSEAAVELNQIMWKPICDFIHLSCHHEQYAKDLTQDTFRTALKLAKDGKVRCENCPSWMMGIAIRKSKNFLRKKHRKEVQAEEAFLESVFAYDNIYEQVHMQMSLEKLPPKEMKVLVLHIQGFTYQEIGDMMNISESTVKRIQLSAKDKLEKEFER